MFKVMILNEFGKSEICDLPIIPRIGDTIPLFFQPYPSVTAVALLPESLNPALEGKGLDAVVTVQ